MREKGIHKDEVLKSNEELTKKKSESKRLSAQEKKILLALISTLPYKEFDKVRYFLLELNKRNFCVKNTY